MTAPLRRWLTPVVAVIAALTVLAGPLPAHAAPTTPTPSGHEEDNEPQLITDVIEQANRDYSAAKSKLDKSKKRQLELALEVNRAKADLDALTPQVGQIAAQSYRTGRMGALAMLLESDAPDMFVQRAAALDEMNMVNEQKLSEVNAVKARAEQAKLALDTEIREQQKQTALMAKRKSEADKALSLVGGKGFTGGLVDATSRSPGSGRVAPPTATGRPSRAARRTPPRPPAASRPARCTRTRRSSGPASTGSSAATAPAGRGSTRRAAPATGRCRRAASRRGTTTTPGSTATTSQRSSSVTPTGWASTT